MPQYEHLLEFDENMLRIASSRSAEFATLCDEEEQHQYLLDNYGRLDFLKRLQRPQLRLRIAGEKCLIRTLKLPVTNRAKARQIAELQGRTALPFEPGQVVFDHAIADSEDGLTTITTIFVKLDILEHQLQFLARAGCRPDIVDAKKPNGEGYGVNFLSGSGQRGISAFAIPLLLTTAFLLFLATLHFEWDKRASALTQLDIELFSLKTKVNALLKKSAEANAVADSVISLRRKRAVEPPMIEIWGELTRTLPDTAWISQLQATKRKVSISGFATEAAPLIGILEHEPLFRQVAFTNPVSFDPSVGAERFGISFELDPAGPTDERSQQEAPH
jgi:general secretion pathway protein L